MSKINNRGALTFLNLDEQQQVRTINKENTIEDQINKGMQNAIHEYLIKEWGEYYLNITTDSFGIDTNTAKGELKHTKK